MARSVLSGHRHRPAVWILARSALIRRKLGLNQRVKACDRPRRVEPRGEGDVSRSTRKRIIRRHDTICLRVIKRPYKGPEVLVRQAADASATTPGQRAKGLLQVNRDRMRWLSTPGHGSGYDPLSVCTAGRGQMMLH